MATIEDAYLRLGPDEIFALEEEYLFPTYKRYDLFISHGSGAYVYDLKGRKYLDFLGGIAVNSLGYNHPRLVNVLMQQGQKVIHCSNLIYHPYQGALARRLANLSGMSKVFFTNSGTEAIEGAMKIARAHARSKENSDKSVILALKNSFHGRTFGALSLTAQEEYQAPFRPLVPDVEIVQELSVAALRRSFTDRVCALVLEPIQGEGGIHAVSEEVLLAARELCDRNKALLILDEIQCGLGRTGKFFAFQHYGIQPDIVTLAKSLAAGFPLGAILGSAKVAGSLKPGDHGTTFGGGPLACRLALEVLDIIEDEKLLPRVSSLGDLLTKGLRELALRHPIMGEVRGRGLMIGAELGNKAKAAVQGLLKKGFIANVAHETVLRLLPPFIITEKQIEAFLAGLDQVLTEIEESQQN
jgi:acetylornithine/N-succinyldiaminopimelate aminotransferase